MSKKVQVSKNYVLKIIAGEAVAIPVGQNVVDGKCIMELTMDAYELLAKVEQGMDFEEIIDTTMREKEFPEEVRESFIKDVEQFYEQMCKEGILENE